MLFVIMLVSVLLLVNIVESNFIGLLSELKVEKGEDVVCVSFFCYFGVLIMFFFVIVVMLVVVFLIFFLLFIVGFIVVEKRSFG